MILSYQIAHIRVPVGWRGRRSPSNGCQLNQSVYQNTGVIPRWPFACQRLFVILVFLWQATSELSSDRCGIRGLFSVLHCLSLFFCRSFSPTRSNTFDNMFLNVDNDTISWLVFQWLEFCPRRMLLQKTTSDTWWKSKTLKEKKKKKLVYFFVAWSAETTCGSSPSFFVPGRPSCGWGKGVNVGVTPQISRA